MNKNDVTIDDLAQMVAKGFISMEERMDKGFEEVRQEVKELREQNERDHTELKLLQDNTAYRFELQDLNKRVTRLEKDAKLA